VREGRVRELRGIGKGIEAKLRELVETGEIAELRTLERELRPELVGIARLVGLGTARMLEAARALDLETVADLRAAAENGRLRSVPGIGPSTEAKVLERLTAGVRAPRGLTLDRSRVLTRAVADALGGHVAGPARRAAELSDALAVVCAADDPQPLLDRFAELPAVVGVIEGDARRAVGVTLDGVPVTLVAAEPARFGTELFRATGSPEFVAPFEPLPDAADEESLFAALGLAFRPPELREAGVPEPGVPLVHVEDLRGDLHCHTTWSDGRASVREMAAAALARGYEYLAICDHTPNVRVVPGLDAAALERQAEEIAEANAELAPFRVLRGVECDIRADGSLDVDERVLAGLEWVQLSLHAGQRRPGPELTRMVTEAMRNPHVRALSHPKGRILNHRAENALDLDEVFATAVAEGVALEVNGLPDRLDLSATHVREALAAGVELVLNSDAHSPRGLASAELAVATARRGGAGAAAIVNARPVASVLGRRRG
jgi:DNA polymerase (family 10)